MIFNLSLPEPKILHLLAVWASHEKNGKKILSALVGKLMGY